MATVTFTPPPNLPELTARVRAAEELFKRPDPILKAFGVTVLGWIGDTFREGGRPKWKPLAESTLAGRREAPKTKRTPRGGGGSLGTALQDTGALRRSFDFRITDRRCTVFSDNPVAIFHEFGTATYRGRPPYVIRPVHAKALALPMLTKDSATGRVKGQKSFRGFARATPTGRGSYLLPKNARHPRAGKVAVPYNAIMFRKEVHHPGVAPRPMLPTNEQIVPALSSAANRIILLALTKKA